MARAGTHVLGLFAKWPRPGAVKTRLAGPERAAAIARAFLLDALDRLSALPVRRLLAFAPPEHEADFAALAQGRFDLVPQADGVDAGAGRGRHDLLPVYSRRRSLLRE